MQATLFHTETTVEPGTPEPYVGLQRRVLRRLAGRPGLTPVPMTVKDANAFVARHHAHHGPVRGARFVSGFALDGEPVGCVIVGRCSSRHLDGALTAEVTRLCIDRTRPPVSNLCSRLLASARHGARALGYRKLVSYILDSETGASYRASGWYEEARTTGGSWDRESRPRTDKAPTCPKRRFATDL